MKSRGLFAMTVVVLAVLAATSCARRSPRRAAPATDDPLEAGWRFACAITNDADDRAACQERIALAYLDRGDSERALVLGEQIENWRRGVVLAEAAAKLAEGGQTNAARARAAEAEAIGRGIQDWQRDRILARAAKSAVFLGQEAEVGRRSAFYRSNPEYRGELAAYQALTLARRGAWTNALAVLDGLADSTHLDVSSWRANGYLLLAKAEPPGSAQTREALAQAWAASARVPGTKRWDVRLGLVEEAVALNEAASARSWLEEVSTNLLAAAPPAYIHAPLVAQLAVRWGLLREAERVAACERAAEPLIRQLQAIEQPALFALLGEAWARLGDTQKGLTYYEHAMALAGQLTNPRPRAMAGVDICLSLERARLRHRPVSEGLNRLLAGFGATHG